MNDEELLKYWELFNRAWQLFKRYKNVSDQDWYWDKLMGDVGELCWQIPGEMCEELSMTIINELERIAEKEKP